MTTLIIVWLMVLSLICAPMAAVGAAFLHAAVKAARLKRQREAEERENG